MMKAKPRLTVLSATTEHITEHAQIAGGTCLWATRDLGRDFENQTEL